MRGRLAILILGFLWSIDVSPAAAAQCKDPKTKRFVKCATVVESLIEAQTKPVDELPPVERKLELLRTLRPDLALELEARVDSKGVPVPPTEAEFDAALVKALSPKRPLRLGGRGGAIMHVSTDTEAEVEPYVFVGVRAPLTTWTIGPELDFTLELTALPGASLNTFDPSTFKAIEASAGLCQPLPEPLLFYLCGRAGFASRLATSSEPLDRLPGYVAAEVLFETADANHRLAIDFGADERLSGTWAPTLSITGSTRLPVGELGGAGLYLFGSYIRALDVPGRPVPSSDSLRMGVAGGF